jgi:hypothetical protein
MELIDFLTARFAEEEWAAQGQVELRRDRYPGEDFTPDKGEVGFWVDRGPWLQAEPLHVLAECVAKRAIIEVARPGGDTVTVLGEIKAEGTYPDEVLAAVAPVVQSFEDALERALAVVLRCLALPYHSHPDFQQEWARG